MRGMIDSVHSDFNPVRLLTLRTLCDTYVPSLKVTPDPLGFWARSASDLHVDSELAAYMGASLPPPVLSAQLAFLDVLTAKGFATQSQADRERTLAQLAKASTGNARALGFYQRQVLLLNYGLPATPVPDRNAITYGSPAGQNPNWEVLGYPGPLTVPPRRPKRIQTLTPGPAGMSLDADVCIIGSGAGGSVVAAKLAESGWNVVVLEAGGHYNSADFHQQELWGYRHLWYRGGTTPTDDGNVAMMAGATLGGGTEVNWMNCVRTPDVVRRDWARDFGLSDVDTPAFDRYMDEVQSRLSANQACAVYNSQNLRMREGCAKLGYKSAQTFVNWDPQLFNPALAGYTGFGDQTGGKMTSRRTWLRDAFEHGARFIVNCRVDRIVTENGRAAGVEATYSSPGGYTSRVAVRARHVVAGAGSLETPPLLLRSGIGGPAVGKYLHLQPGGAIYAVYREKQRGWWSTPMSTNCEQFVDTGGGWGFYMEIPAFGAGFISSVIPWTSGRQHKEVLLKVPWISTFIFFLRDRSNGQVTIDATGNSVVRYSLDDETDQKNFRHADCEAVKIHEAAGAMEILVSIEGKQISWKRGAALEPFLRTVGGLPVLHGAQTMISAHQLSSCRIGVDKSTSVANPDGELHSVKGVWIADASACPTSLGANPMVTIMSLASRTADRMLAAGSGSWRMVPFRSMFAVPALNPNSLNPAAVIKEAMDAVSQPMTAMVQLLSQGAERAAAMAVRPGVSRAAAVEDRPVPGQGPMYSHIIELKAKAGRGRDLVNAIRDQAIPRIIVASRGFVDELVLESDTAPESVTAISFWRTRHDGEQFLANSFSKVSALLAPYLQEAPRRKSFVVGASTNDSIKGW